MSSVSIGAAVVVAAIAGSQILEPLQSALSVILEMSLVEQFCVMVLMLALLLGVVAASSADAAGLGKPKACLSPSFHANEETLVREKSARPPQEAFYFRRVRARLFF